MTATAPGRLTRQQVISLLSQHKQEWSRLYGIQDITMVGSWSPKRRNSRRHSGLLREPAATQHLT